MHAGAWISVRNLGLIAILMFIFYPGYLFATTFSPNTDVKTSETSNVSTENKF